jgi:hypothetical protein
MPASNRYFAAFFLCSRLLPYEGVGVGVTVGAGVGVGVTTADVLEPSLGSFLKVMKRVTKDRGNRHFSGSRYEHLIDDVRRILRKTSGADRIDPASGENIRSVFIYRHRDRPRSAPPTCVKFQTRRNWPSETVISSGEPRMILLLNGPAKTKLAMPRKKKPTKQRRTRIFMP